MARSPIEPLQPMHPLILSRWWPVLIALTGVLMTLVLWHALREHERGQIERSVEAEAVAINSEITSRMEARILTLVRMADRWQPRASDEPALAPDAAAARRDWEREAALNLAHFPGIRAFRWNAPGGETRWRVSLTPVDVQAEAAAVNEPRRRQAREAARSTGTVRLTRPVTLTSGGRGFLAYAPMGRGPRSAGWISGAFAYQPLFDAILPGIAPGYALAVFQDGVLVYSPVGGRPDPPPVLERRTTISVYGARWEVNVWPLPAQLAAMRSPLPLATLIGGLAGTLLLVVAFWFAQTASRRSLALAREAAERRRVESAREKEHRFLQTVLDTIRLLQRITALANETASIERTVQGAIEQICAHMGWVAGHGVIPAGGGEGHQTASDIWYFPPATGLEAVRDAGGAVGLGTSALGEAVFANGRPQWVLAPPAGPVAAALGLRAAYAFPARAGDATVAVLEFFGTEPLPPDADALEVLEAVGLQLGLAVRRQQVERAIAASELRFRALAETASDAIITVDDAGRIIYGNDVVERIFGYAAREVLGESLTVLMPERFHESYLAGFARFLRTREAAIMGRPIELVGRHRDGAEVPVELSLASWESEGRVYFTGILRDITARKQAEAALTEKMDELARTNAELGLFTYVASHDLREPLRTVSGNIQLLERRLGDQLSEDARKQIGFAIGGVQRMQALIDDLLVYSRVGTEGQPFAPVDMDEVLGTVRANLAAAIAEEGGQVTSDPLPTVQADRTQMVQLLQNLIANGLKFHRDGAPRVHVAARREADAWLFSVRDEGIGIEPQYAEHIFTIFQRLHSDEFPGTGIGLAVCRRIIERHRGRIWVESALGQGSTFWFTIPRGGARR